jgi:hypothetical protein
MRAHTEVDDTFWSFVKEFLQVLVQNNYTQPNFFFYLENTSFAVLKIYVASFSYAYIFQETFKHKFLLKF